ncbi:glycoside hydrolase 43 family protein [Sphingobacterium sp. lm-10]|uniref:glycoside hydrolase family 43 protein n=1 Tax=Sphingobacterium sp. lm-10 TaxID=2944904 RepID=UPI00201FBC37|nr:glycoside hydrolase 43 family protein [Sphingobacterium sp. lm-10]MCL7986678.1 glycoside hydrolase 43 family protein [Sphingobacterium sp. lm-10]
MNIITKGIVLIAAAVSLQSNICQGQELSSKKATNPIIFSDVPDLSMIRVGDTYYMSSTTMHLNPGLPLMKSRDLVNWELFAYRHTTLQDMDELNLDQGKNAYGNGSWASSLRYHRGTYYLSTFAQTTGKTYIYMTKDIEHGPWETKEFEPALHDHTLFFEEDKIYMIWGGGQLHIVELETDFSGIKPETQQVLIENATVPSTPDGAKGGLPAEGSQLFKVNGKYYLFNISWPPGGMRTVIVHRADQLHGPYEGRVVLQDQGVAQGGLIDMPDGRWYAYLFQDYGAVGRIPFLVPVHWEDEWPVLGVNGKVPAELDLPASKGLIPGIVNSDDFTRKPDEPALPLVWQWNHNPDDGLWSVSERAGYLRLKTGRIDDTFLQARNTLTQRTIGPTCVGSTAIEVANMKDGDFAGLSLLQKNYGLLGVRMVGSKRSLVMVNATGGNPEEVADIPINQDRIYLRASCDFTDKKDIANFSYSLDGETWNPIGTPLKMMYTIPHFMGYRFGLFNYATKEAGGYVDFDYFHISN